VAYLLRAPPIEATAIGLKDIEAFRRSRQRRYCRRTRRWRERGQLVEFRDVLRELERNPLRPRSIVKLKPERSRCRPRSLVAERCRFGFRGRRAVRARLGREARPPAPASPPRWDRREPRSPRSRSSSRHTIGCGCYSAAVRDRHHAAWCAPTGYPAPFLLQGTTKGSWAARWRRLSFAAYALIDRYLTRRRSQP